MKFPNESVEYRSARKALLEAERALRAQTEAVARLRRELPAGGEVPEDYVFSELGQGRASEAVRMSALFGDHDTLFLYGLMYGPDAKRPCPMCSSFLDGLDGNASAIGKRISLVIVARSNPERIAALASERGWNHLRFVSSEGSDFPTLYGAESESGNQMPMANVFVREGATVSHHWGSELLYASSDDGCDSRHIDPMWPLWNVLDTTPAGRGTFYP
jgi:predicted dithiol-disulfide oxidoreductase (DUF899 family)